MKDIEELKKYIDIKVNTLAVELSKVILDAVWRTYGTVVRTHVEQQDLLEEQSEDIMSFAKSETDKNIAKVLKRVKIVEQLEDDKPIIEDTKPIEPEKSEKEPEEPPKTPKKKEKKAEKTTGTPQKDAKEIKEEIENAQKAIVKRKTEIVNGVRIKKYNGTQFPFADYEDNAGYDPDDDLENPNGSPI